MKAHSKEYFLSNVVINVASVGDSGMRSGIPFPSQTGCNYRGTLGSSLIRYRDWGGRSKTCGRLLWISGDQEKDHSLGGLSLTLLVQL